MLNLFKKSKKSEEDVRTFTVWCEHVDCEENVKLVINQMLVSKINDFVEFTGKKLYHAEYDKILSAYSEKKGWTGTRTAKVTFVK